MMQLIFEIIMMTVGRVISVCPDRVISEKH